VVATQQDSVRREARALGRAADPLRELLRRLTRVATKLVHLAGGRFHMKNRTIFDCLLDRCFEDLRVGRTDGVRTASSRLPVTSQNIPKPDARIFASIEHLLVIPTPL